MVHSTIQWNIFKGISGWLLADNDKKPLKKSNANSVETLVDVTNMDTDLTSVICYEVMRHCRLGEEDWRSLSDFRLRVISEWERTSNGIELGVRYELQPTDWWERYVVSPALVEQMRYRTIPQLRVSIRNISGPYECIHYLTAEPFKEVLE